MKRTSVWVAGAAVLIASASLAVATQNPAGAVPPGSNGKIAFNFHDSDGMVVMNANGTNQVIIAGGGHINPSWSPDSSRIAFARNLGTGGPGLNYEIYTMDPDGTNLIRLTNNPAQYDTNPAWSPHGKIAFSSNRSGEHQIWVMNADGSDPVQVTGLSLPSPLDPLEPQTSGSKPAWSPDESKLAYVSAEEGDASEIYTINADGTNPHQLTNSAEEDSSPSWSPDGTKIVFDRQDDIFTPGDLWVMNADGTNQVRLTNHPDNEAEPVWSPDGTKIAFVSNRDGLQAVFVMNADGTNQVNLTPGVEADEPDWGRKAFKPFPPVTRGPPTIVAKCWGKVPTIIGTKGNDTIVGTEGPDVIAGLGGADTIRGLGGNDRICGTGRLRIDGGDGDDRLKGSRGDDRLKGGDGDDRIEGGRGDDRLKGGDGDDRIEGGRGDDRLAGNSGNDHLGGGPDTDRIKGGSGRDKLYGGSGTYDLCKGGRGYDRASEGCEKKTGIQRDLDD